MYICKVLPTVSARLHEAVYLVWSTIFSEGETRSSPRRSGFGFHLKDVAKWTNVCTPSINKSHFRHKM